MDKFDEIIKNTQQKINPSETFVDATMHQIDNRQIHKRWNLKIWAPTLAGALAVLIVLFITLVPGNNNTPKSSSQTKSTTTQKQTTTQPGTVITPPAGTDDASLQNNLNNIQSAINQENTDQNSATSTINDNQQEITVPTD